jgi:hypothetical protein
MIRVGTLVFAVILAQVMVPVRTEMAFGCDVIDMKTGRPDLMACADYVLDQRNITDLSRREDQEAYVAFLEEAEQQARDRAGGGGGNRRLLGSGECAGVKSTLHIAFADTPTFSVVIDTFDNNNRLVPVNTTNVTFDAFIFDAAAQHEVVSKVRADLAPFPVSIITDPSNGVAGCFSTITVNERPQSIPPWRVLNYPSNNTFAWGALNFGAVSSVDFRDTERGDTGFVDVNYFPLIVYGKSGL